MIRPRNPPHPDPASCAPQRSHGQGVLSKILPFTSEKQMLKAQSSPCDWIACDLPWAPEEPGKVRLLPALPGRGLESFLIVLTLLWEQDFCLESKCSSCRNTFLTPLPTPGEQSWSKGASRSYAARLLPSSHCWGQGFGRHVTLAPCKLL